MRWSSYIAVGDSFTEGLEDPHPEGRHRGWADRLAEHLAAHDPQVRYANLAVRGRRLPEIMGVQVPQAVALQPDLISIAAGVNDALRPRWDLRRSADWLVQGVTAARDSGADVLLISFGNPSRRSRALATITNRLRDYREHMLAIGEETGSIVLDLWHETVFDDPRFWADDRLHLNAAGHERMAGAAAEALGLPSGPWRTPLATGRAAGVLQGLRGDVSWTARHLGPWVGRRVVGRSSGDAIGPKRPTLTPVAARWTSAGSLQPIVELPDRFDRRLDR